MVCAICGRKNEDGNAFCKGCHADLHEFSQKDKSREDRCIECGAKLDDGRDGRCPDCGASQW